MKRILLALACLTLAGCMRAEVNDGTDTGVGCTDDCLEPMGGVYPYLDLVCTKVPETRLPDIKYDCTYRDSEMGEPIKE